MVEINSLAENNVLFGKNVAFIIFRVVSDIIRYLEWIEGFKSVAVLY